MHCASGCARHKVKDLKPLTAREEDELYRNRHNVFGLNAAKRRKPSEKMQAVSVVPQCVTRTPSVIVVDDDDDDDVAKFQAALDADDISVNAASAAAAAAAAAVIAHTASAVADTASRSGIRAKVDAAHQARAHGACQ